MYSYLSTIMFALVFLITACTVAPIDKDSIIRSSPETDPQQTSVPEQSSEQTDRSITPLADGGPQSDAKRGRQYFFQEGTGQYLGTPEKRQGISETEEGETILNFQGVDINEFIKAILGGLLNENFIIDPQVSGSITVEMPKPINKAELFPLFEKILSIHNLVIIKSDNLYQILPRAKAIQGNLAPDISSVDTAKTSVPGYSARIIPLQYIAVEEMKKILAPFIKEGSNVNIDQRRNVLILSGTAEELDTLQETIDIFDVDWLRGMSMAIYTLKYVDPKTLKSELDSILTGLGGTGNQKILDGLVQAIPIERLNAMLLISSTLSALRETENWLQRLDRPGEASSQHLHVYQVQNAKAVELANILSNIFGAESAGSTAPIADNNFGLVPGETPVTISNENVPPDAPLPPPELPIISPSDPQTSSLLTTGTIKIIADDTRNALVVLATPGDYKMIETTIKKLDIVPLQVLIEASILEVTLDDELSYGVEWFFDNAVDADGRIQLDLGAANIGPLSGFSYTIINDSADIRVALNALQTESEINVLSSPSLMVLDNQTATINVGDEIPVPTRQSVSNVVNTNAPTVSEIQYRKTGVTLEVTPRVNNSGLVTMELRQEVSNAVATTSSEIEAPTIQQRRIESTIAINSGETIVLGGLIQDSQTNNKGGVPLFHDIPLLGNLFGQTSSEGRRTELIVLLTPRIVRSYQDARKITEEFRYKLHSLRTDVKQTQRALEASPLSPAPEEN